MKISENGVSPQENRAKPARKVIITCAVTGSIHTPSMSPALPITTDEIAEASIEAARAGAAIIHLHARDPETGQPSADPAHFRPFLKRIHEETDAIINISTGGSSVMPLDARLAAPRETEPEMCSLNMGSMNFGTFPMLDKYSEWQHNWEPDLLDATRRTVFKNTFEDIETILDDLGKQRSARFEFECYDLGQVETLGFYVKNGLVKPPLYIQFVLGVLGGAGASVENLVAMKNCADRVIPCDYHFSVLAAGGRQMAMAAMGAIMGGNVRVGLEDNLTIAPGVLAQSNAEQVGKIRRIVEELGLEAATPDETRALLALKGRNRVKF
ncbi:3-keto-5-aminohexanoate cleavage protein [Hyphococcus luteus]|uniref:3-keto-5-aminohexanoate cleavage protein n=1 Tax=Hyphococcus luteus TaxID=2058213 RepID=A0A2S7KA35_9PROT|nr:3-keto-5-aminohexanoate cleavage protein [Marinicaulis flavus]PQA89341.1 3-keto-5-aminohexanoate cleavage protein [Marinicaulis flavus]